MDIVGVGIITTFFSMLVMSVFGMQAQKPPSFSAKTNCPASGEPAELSLRWDRASQSLAVEACDSHAFNHGCGQVQPNSVTVRMNHHRALLQVLNNHLDLCTVPAIIPMTMCMEGGTCHSSPAGLIATCSSIPKALRTTRYPTRQIVVTIHLGNEPIQTLEQ